MTKRVTLVLMISMLVMLCSCMSTNMDKNNTKAPEVKILQNRVIEVTYADFDYDKASEYLSSRYDKFGIGGCSAVKTMIDGKVYVGRNYDFFCSDSPAFVVRNNSGKYRTIGIANSPMTFPAWSENYQVDKSKLTALPYLCCDVMSEAGIYAETNIRQAEAGLICSSTNPGKPRRCTQVFLQYMLSNYDSIKEIISHLDDYDWFDLSAQPDMGFCQSFMLVDQTGYSVVIEFAANSYRVTECDYNANFFINNDYYAKENYPIGRMRVSKELAFLPYVRTPEDVFTMMSKGSYAQFYTLAIDPDYAIDDFMDDVGCTRFTVDENREEARTKMKELLTKYDTYTWDELIKNKCWETTFCNVANISDLTFNVHFSEHYGIHFQVGF